MVINDENFVIDLLGGQALMEMKYGELNIDGLVVCRDDNGELHVKHPEQLS